MKCDICGFPARDNEVGFDVLRDHLLGVHGIEGVKAQWEHMDTDPPEVPVVLLM